MLNRTSYFDLLNVTSCISVIALHCNGFYHQYSCSPIWKFTAFVQVVFYCAVPIFFMLSGATLLNYLNRYSTKEFYKKRIKKTVIPYVFFTIAFYGLYVVGHFVRHNEIDLNLMNFFKYLSNGRIPFANYWFFIPLFCIYLLMPFLSKIVINSSKKELEFLIVIMFVFQSFLPIIDYFTKFNTIPVLPITGYVFFLFLGYYLAKYDIEKNNKFLISVLILTIALFVIRFILILNVQQRVELLQSYFGVYSVIPSVFIFCFAKRFWNQENGLYKYLRGGVQILSGFSFGVYLIHQVIIEVLASLFNYESWIMCTVGIIITYSVSCFIVFCIQKIKFFRWIFPN